MKQFLIIPLVIALLTSCAIEPPLRLPQEAQDILLDMPAVITDLEVMWDVKADWRAEWYYGWDADDERLWGKLEYPLPTNFEVRRYFNGEQNSPQFLAHDAFTVYGNSFRRRYNFGYYDMLLWSNIDSPDGTQSVVIDERDMTDIRATTTATRVGYGSKYFRSEGEKEMLNQPEIFYNSRIEDLYISRNEADYDYYDAEEGVWVKRIKDVLTPAVCIYLVQVVLHNNKSRIIGTGDKALISGLAEAVSLSTGVTSATDASITFDMRLKKDLDCDGEACDVLGGKLTTFGLCEMTQWSPTRSGSREVTRSDIDNRFTLCLMSRNGQEVVITKDVTEDMRKRMYGGVLTLHVNVDEMEIFSRPSDSGFNPSVSDYGKQEFEFEI